MSNRRKLVSLVYQGAIAEHRVLLAHEGAVRDCVEYLRARARSLSATPGLSGRQLLDAADAIERTYLRGDLSKRCIDFIEAARVEDAEALVDAVIERKDGEA
jgi:hypothetical protein